MTATRPSSDLAAAASELRLVLGQLVRRLRAEHAFPIGQGIVLGALDREGPATTAALAAAQRVRPQSMAQTLAEMQADGLVERRPDPADRRQVLIEITPAGRERLRDDRRRSAGWLAGAMADLGADEQQTLIAAVPLLERLAQS